MKTKKKVFRSKISTNFGYRLKILEIFHDFLCEDQKKRSSSQKFYEIRCESTKITKIRAVHSNLGVSGLDLHSNSPKPVNFFGAQSSLEGGTSSHLGGTAPEFPPWRRACCAYVLNCAKLDTKTCSLNVFFLGIDYLKFIVYDTLKQPYKLVT